MIFGTGYPLISGSLGPVALEHSKINYNLFESDVQEHRSVLTGHINYPYARNRSTLQVDLLLCEYSGTGESSSFDKFNAIYQYKNQYFYLYPHVDDSASLSGVGGPVEFYMSEFTPYYLSNDERYDGVLMTFSPRKNSIIYPIDDTLGYGLTPYGLNYGL